MSRRFRRLATPIAALTMAGLYLGPPPSTASTDAAQHLPSVALSPCVPADNGFPDLLSFSAAPATVDVRKAAKTVTFTVAAADRGGPGAATGIDTVGVNDQPLVRQADGTWQGHLRLYPGTRAGTETLRVTLEDGADNVQVFRPAWLASHGMASGYTVVSRTDRTPPLLRELQLSRTHVDTRTSAATVRVRAHVVDAQSGVRWVDLEAFGSDIERGTLHLAKGTRADGWWAGHVRFRRWLGNGSHLLGVQMVNRAGRFYEVGPQELEATGRPSAVVIRSRTDDRRPAIGQGEGVPSRIDATTSDTQALLRVPLSDAGAGVRSAVVSMTNQATGSSLSVRLRLQSGTRRDGLWQGVFQARSCTTEAGTYVGRVEAADRADNGRLGSRDLALSVANLDRVPPRVAQLSPPSSVTSPLTVTFTEDVVGVSSTSAPVRPLIGRFPVDVDPLPAHPGTWSCRSATAAVVDCLAGPVRIAQWTPSAPLSADTYYVVDVNPEFVLDVMDLSGNPVQEMSIPFTGAPAAE